MLDIRKIISDAIQNKEILQVRYSRKEGGISERDMEPFDISSGTRTPNGPEKFWGWCLLHNNIEGKLMERILEVTNTGKKFDPSIREKIFGNKQNYKIPRNW